MKRSTLLLCMLIFVSLGLSVVRIALSAALSTSGIDLTHLQSEKDAVQKENMILREIVYTNASLTHIAESAVSLGFDEKSKNTSLVLSVPSTVAFKQ